MKKRPGPKPSEPRATVGRVLSLNAVAQRILKGAEWVEVRSIERGISLRPMHEGVVPRKLSGGRFLTPVAQFGLRKGEQLKGTVRGSEIRFERAA